jgi:hypothetical protein
MIAIEEMGKACSNVQPIKSSCMAPRDMANAFVEKVRALVAALFHVLVLWESLPWRYISR